LRELFHYTSAGGLEGIVKSQSLHAGHVRFMNDTSELLSADGYLRENLIHTVLETTFFPEAKVELNFYDMRLRLENHEPLSNQVVDEFLREVRDQLDVYTCSFCYHERPDDMGHGLLSQWRAYGNDGGYCIVFDADKLRQSLMNWSKQFDLDYFDFEKVSYLGVRGFHDISEIVSRILDLYKFHYNKIAEHKKYFEPKDTWDTVKLFDVPENAIVHSEMMKTAKRILPFLKHGSFHEENEVRVVLVPSLDGSVSNSEKTRLRVCHKLRNQTFFPYIELLKSYSSGLPITRIIVGPGQNSENRLKGLNSFLDSCDFPIGQRPSVSVSQIPFV
jgi:hypothetical protein